jgi:multiple sugar transport system substrate-binding protein
MRDGDTAGGTHHAPQRTERPDGTAHDRAGAPPQTRPPRQTRRGLLSSGGALAGLGTAGAVACAGPGIPGGGASAPRLAPASVSLLFPGWSPEQIEQLDLVVQRIGEANPGVTVEKIQAVGSAGDKLATMIAGGTPPEVAWHGGLFARFAGSGQLRPVDDYLARDRDVRPADFYPTAWENTRFGGKVMGLPYMTQTFVVHYNKNLFRAAGLDAPKEDWTFDDLLSAARRLNRPEQLWGARFDDYLGCYILYGGRAAPDYSRVTVSNPTNQGVLQFLRDLWARHNVAPPPGPQFRDKSPEQQFAEGRVAITMRHSIQLRFMRKIDGFEWDVAPMPWFQAPGGQRARKAGLEMEFFALTAGGQAPDQAWAVAKFLTGKENVGWSSEAGFSIPAIKGLAESKAFLDPARPPARARAFLDAFGYADWRFWRHRATSELDGAVGRALGGFLAPDATLTAKEALDGLAQQLETILDQFGRSAG